MVRSMMCRVARVARRGLGAPPIAAAEKDRRRRDRLSRRPLFPQCGRERSIGVDLSNAWVTDADLAKLARLTRLESINLAYTKITDLGLEHLAPLQNVKVLDLYYAESVSDLGIAHLKHWKNLEHLNVRGTKVTSSLFEHISKMTKLRFLDVGHSRVNDDLFETPGKSRSSRASRIRRQQDERRRTTSSEILARARELSVSGQQRTDSGLWSVSVTDFNVSHIAQLDQLEVLDLGETNVSDRGIAELAHLKNLQTLDLRATRVTSKGIAALSGLPKLRHLKLWKARGIDDAAVPTLLQMEKPGNPRVAGDEPHRRRGWRSSRRKRA